MTGMPDLINVISAASTVVLVGVTAWYAVLTNKLAKSSRDAADAAREAALASQKAAEVAEAQVPAEFSVRPYVQGINNAPTLLAGVDLRCDGAIVFVHGCVLNEYTLVEPPSTYSTVHSALTDRSLPVALKVSVQAWTDRLGQRPDRINVPELPHRLHGGEEIFFEVPADVEIRNGDFRTLDVTVYYSITGKGAGYPRAVHGSVRRDDPLRWNWPTGAGY